MSMALVRLGCMMLLTMPSAVELSIWMGIGGCVCPSSSSRLRSGMASSALMYRAPSSASAAEDMTDLMICAIVSIAPLFRGTLLFSKSKKWLPARLQALVSER